MEMSGEQLRRYRETGQKPHKHCDLIKAWADGAEIQDYDEELGKWCNSGTYPMWATHIQYRIKPKTLRYRNYLRKHWKGNVAVDIATEETFYLNAERFPGFIKWLGDWQEVEV